MENRRRFVRRRAAPKAVQLPADDDLEVRPLPDRRAIAFANNSGGLSDIWLQPLNGSQPKQLTNFRAEQIIAFDWSRDGRSLAFVRGVETGDVVLIGNAALK